MTEKPPKGSAKNFGLRALQHWAEMLAKTSKGSWAREYASGRPLLAALTTAYTFMGPAFGKTVPKPSAMSMPTSSTRRRKYWGMRN